LRGNPPECGCTQMSDDSEILVAAIGALTYQFDKFIQASMVPDGKPRAVEQKDLAQARACMPRTHKSSFNYEE
jgi:hypothetical protein